VLLIDAGTGDVRWNTRRVGCLEHGLAGDGTVIAAFHLGNELHVWDGQTRRETVVATECEQVCNIVTCQGGSILAATTAERRLHGRPLGPEVGGPVRELRWHRRRPGTGVSMTPSPCHATCMPCVD